MNTEVLVAGRGRPYVDGDWLDHTAPLVFTIANVLDAGECAALVERIDAEGPSDAPITTARGFVMRPDIRNNQRVIFDDVAFASALYSRITPALPAAVAGMRPCGVNERFRCYRYQPGQRFAPHYDGAFARDGAECSQLTFMIYLNEGFGGGSTKFHDFEVEVVPRTGLALLFQHHLLHEGAVVESGVKYALRSDVMYRS